MSDQWGPLPIAQQFPAVAPDGITKLLDVIHRLQVDVTESRASILSSVAKIVADLTAKQATLDAQQATLTAQQATLTAQQATLTTTVAGLVTTNATLTAQQATLTAAVANIATLVGQQTRPDAGNASSGTVNPLPATGGSFATITFNVPAGYTVASVVGNSSAVVAGPIGSAQMMTRIAGLDGPSMDVYSEAPSNVGNGSSNFSRVFSVTPSGTFTVETRVVSPNGGAGRFTTAASVTFSR